MLLEYQAVGYTTSYLIFTRDKCPGRRKGEKPLAKRSRRPFNHQITKQISETVFLGKSAQSPVRQRSTSPHCRWTV